MLTTILKPENTYQCTTRVIFCELECAAVEKALGNRRCLLHHWLWGSRWAHSANSHHDIYSLSQKTWLPHRLQTEGWSGFGRWVSLPFKNTMDRALSYRWLPKKGGIVSQWEEWSMNTNTESLSLLADHRKQRGWWCWVLKQSTQMDKYICWERVGR
jgi:hypothetical protein